MLLKKLNRNLIFILLAVTAICATPVSGFATPVSGFATPVSGFATPAIGFAAPASGLKASATGKTVTINRLLTPVPEAYSQKTSSSDNQANEKIILHNSTLQLNLDYSGKAAITTLIVNGRSIISGGNEIYTSVKSGGIIYSSLHLLSKPVLLKSGNMTRLNGIVYGKTGSLIRENWIFVTTSTSIKWTIDRSLAAAMPVEEAASPVFTFDHINTWEGAYQGYGGIAWFYLFNQKNNTYGVHTRWSGFWNSDTHDGLNISVQAPGKEVAMKYTRTSDDRLDYTVTVSDRAMVPRLDSGTNRRLFLPSGTEVWAPFTLAAGKSSETIQFTYAGYEAHYGRGNFKGVNGKQVSAVLNTIARIGVIDTLHYGGNSWHTPYGPICLHEQYIAAMGAGINDPHYLKGYQKCLDYYQAHAIKADGRVYPRWAYTDEDMMKGQGNKYGFYEAQWGFLLDSNPDYVTNVAELYDQTGDRAWVKTHQLSCEKALDWILNRDSNHNGLVEMMTSQHEEKKSSDWIDIIWASYENAFVNAKLYHALVSWAAIEKQLGNNTESARYEMAAILLKTSFNKPVTEGGFWDTENSCYVHWLDKDKTVHGRNMVTPVNFMAIAYGICDDQSRQHLILDKIEAQMEQEKLFFWPIAMTTYAPGEGRNSQYPFPEYENGDLFLSWGSMAIKAYAAYKPELALHYVNNVLDQYSKDGLAYQRYGRVKQEGEGDDILSGNSLTIVGLYQSVYGIQPRYNRFYLDPHLAPALYGTVLTYTFRDRKLSISLDSNSYTVTDHRFKIISPRNFGFNTSRDQLSYFNGSNEEAGLTVSSACPLTLSINTWNQDLRAWKQTASLTGTKLTYEVHQLKPLSVYTVSTGGKKPLHIKTDSTGSFHFIQTGSKTTETITISRS